MPSIFCEETFEDVSIKIRVDVVKAKFYFDNCCLFRHIKVDTQISWVAYFLFDTGFAEQGGNSLIETRHI